MLIERIYKQKLVHRYDDNGYIKYFSADDFPGVWGEPFSFRSSENMRRGFFYRCENAKKEKTAERSPGPLRRLSSSGLSEY